jgi:hypothetical protein
LIATAKRKFWSIRSNFKDELLKKLVLVGCPS